MKIWHREYRHFQKKTGAGRHSPYGRLAKKTRGDKLDIRRKVRSWFLSLTFGFI